MCIIIFWDSIRQTAKDINVSQLYRPCIFLRLLFISHAISVIYFNLKLILISSFALSSVESEAATFIVIFFYVTEQNETVKIVDVAFSWAENYETHNLLYVTISSKNMCTPISSYFYTHTCTSKHLHIVYT